ncbi:MAG: phosphatidate cytidylyltransferase, partial [Actinobacteria bacterium]|nr:phosphatidate cytidylyltransferase [Actinomycetota bacterium]
MAEGEGQEKKEDVFEDLDKFFAPIQDVEWPEPVGKEEEPAGAEAGDEAGAPPLEGPAAGEEETAALEEPVIIEEATETPGQEGLFAEEEREEEEAWAAEEGEEEPAEPYAYETEEEISVEELGAVPSEYAGLPGPLEEELVTAPLEEAPAAPEEEPTPEAVEAAAEHFAESVREEVAAEVEAAPAEELEAPEVVEEELLAELEGPVPPTRTVKVGGAEGLGGPSWQEPTAVEVGAEHERRPSGRDVPAAFLTGLVLAGLAVGSIAIDPAVFAFVAGAIVLLAQGELYGVMHKRHHQPATALGLVSGGLILAAGYLKGEAAMLSMLALTVFATFLWYMAVPAAHRKQTMVNVGLTVLGVVYVPLLAGYALATLKLPEGRELTLSIIGLTFAYDTAAFVVGYFWGSRPFAPTVSPKKSWEGAIGATLVVIAVSVGIVANYVDSLNDV